MLRPDETILLDISPRGPHGYYGDLSRTCHVVDSNAACGTIELSSHNDVRLMGQAYAVRSRSVSPGVGHRPEIVK